MLAAQIFYDATAYFSRHENSITAVIPVMDVIDEALSNEALNANYSAPVRAAATLGKKTLNRYYDRTDHSELYRIAMGTLSMISRDGGSSKGGIPHY